mgnify:CR=1 FL=1
MFLKYVYSASTAAFSAGRFFIYFSMNFSKPSTSSAIGSILTPLFPAKISSFKNSPRLWPSFFLARNAARTAKAPESFYLKDILEASKESIEKGINNEIDSCTLMFHHGMKMHVVEGEYDNIKITTPEDFFTFRAIYDARENEQLL